MHIRREIDNLLDKMNEIIGFNLESKIKKQFNSFLILYQNKTYY